MKDRKEKNLIDINDKFITISVRMRESEKELVDRKRIEQGCRSINQFLRKVIEREISSTAVSELDKLNDRLQIQDAIITGLQELFRKGLLYCEAAEKRVDTIILDKNTKRGKSSGKSKSRKTK